MRLIDNCPIVTGEQKNASPFENPADFTKRLQAAFVRDTIETVEREEDEIEPVVGKAAHIPHIATIHGIQAEFPLHLLYKAFGVVYRGVVATHFQEKRRGAPTSDPNIEQCLADDTWPKAFKDRAFRWHQAPWITIRLQGESTLIRSVIQGIHYVRLSHFQCSN
jgi:hypothetical protein